MITLTNATKSVSVVGKLVSISTTDPNAFIYTTPNASRAIGVVTEAVPYRQKCKIATIGDKARVLVSSNVNKDDIIRGAKSGDNISLGNCKVAKASDAPYLKVGVALTSGTGLISTVLELAFSGDESGVGYVPYTGALDDVDLGTKSISAGGGVLGTAANNVTIDGSGEMSFNGTATRWDDIRIIPHVFDVPGLTDPDIISYQPAGSGATFKVYAFAKGDEGFFTIQLPHSYKEGSTIYPHVHWTPGSRGVAESGKVVQWRLDYSFTNIDGTFPASSTVSLADACDGTDHKHQMTPMGTISGAGLTISSQMLGRIYRYNHVSDTWVGIGVNLPIFIEIDFHYEIDSVGSKTTSDK